MFTFTNQDLDEQDWYLEFGILIMCKNHCFSNSGYRFWWQKPWVLTDSGDYAWEALFLGGVGIYLLVAHHDNQTYLEAQRCIFWTSCLRWGPIIDLSP